MNPRTVKVPFIAGDGIGAEITPACQQVIDLAVQKAYSGKRRIEWVEVMAGQKAFDETGSWLPDETLAAFDEARIGIKGPLTTPVGEGIRSLNVALRQQLDLYACVRPVRWFAGVSSPIKHPERVNMVVFRENTEDVYSGIEWAAGSDEAQEFGRFIQQMGANVRFPDSCAYGVKPVSKDGSTRLVRAAFEYARKNGLDKVTLVHKGNIMKFTEGGFKNWGYEVAKDYPEITTNDVIADAFFQNTILRPQDYSVVATLNLNGDYISDQLAALVGGIGIAPGANVNYETGHAIFEATHGTAPDIAGLDKANPSSLILSAVLMLRHLGWAESADLVEQAMADCFGSGQAPVDLAQFMPGGIALGTREFADKLSSLI